MITKLKWLKAYFTRTVQPAVGTDIGTITYQSKTTDIVDKKYVIDLDANTTVITTIDKTVTPSVTTTTNMLSPKTDPEMYINGEIPVVITGVAQAEFTQSVVEGVTIATINVLTGVMHKTGNAAAIAATTALVDITKVSGDTELTLDLGTGVVTADTSVAGVYTLKYKIADKIEPGVKYTGTIKITVTP